MRKAEGQRDIFCCGDSGLEADASLQCAAATSAVRPNVMNMLDVFPSGESGYYADAGRDNDGTEMIKRNIDHVISSESE